MPNNFIVKIDPNLDAYVYWGRDIDAPHFGGTRAELEEHLRKCGEDAQLDERFDRADDTGTSAKPYQLEGTIYPGFYAWNEPGSDTFVTEQRGLVRRADLLALWSHIGVGRPYPQLLMPFPDGHMVGWDNQVQTT